jgi:hypothetical protein
VNVDPTQRLLKREPVTDQGIVTVIIPADSDDRFNRIRCPLCSWQPKPTSVWCCSCLSTPEPFFPACGTVWNTFSTRGRCPGCSHQWKWTTCLRCGNYSIHEDWYEESRSGGSPS